MGRSFVPYCFVIINSINYWGDYLMEQIKGFSFFFIKFTYYRSDSANFKLFMVKKFANFF